MDHIEPITIPAAGLHEKFTIVTSDKFKVDFHQTAVIFHPHKKGQMIFRFRKVKILFPNKS